MTKKGRPKKSSQGLRFEVTLATQSIALLKMLAKRGIYGRTAPEVGGRFIEHALREFVVVPRLVPRESRRQP